MTSLRRARRAAVISGGQDEPTPLPAAITDLAAVEQSDTSILLTWTPADDAASHEYRVDGGAWTATSDQDSHLVTGLTPETEYDFEVRGVNETGTGPESNTATATTEVVPGSIGDLAAVEQSPPDVLLTWTPATDATTHEYRIDGGAWIETDDPDSHVVTGLDLDTTYEFEVRGINDDFDGPASNTATVTTSPLTGLGVAGTITFKLSGVTQTVATENPGMLGTVVTDAVIPLSAPTLSLSLSEDFDTTEPTDLTTDDLADEQFELLTIELTEDFDTAEPPSLVTDDVATTINP